MVNPFNPMENLQVPFAPNMQLQFYQLDVPTEDLTQETNCMWVAQAVAEAACFCGQLWGQKKKQVS